MKSSGDVLFDDAEIKSLNQLIDNSVNEFIELDLVFRILGAIAVGIDAVILSTLDIKNSLSLFTCCSLFSYFGSCSKF